MSQLRLRLDSAEGRHRLTRAHLLRQVLADHQWHTGTELVVRVGHRFGASILTVSRGDDGGPPWLIKREWLNASGSQWRYRYVRELEPHEVGTGGGTWRAKYEAMRREHRVLLGLLATAGVKVPGYGATP